jgi:hypothetical protein
MMTRLRDGHPRNRGSIPDRKYLHRVQAGPEVHSVSSLMGTGGATPEGKTLVLGGG